MQSAQSPRSYSSTALQSTLTRYWLSWVVYEGKIQCKLILTWKGKLLHPHYLSDCNSPNESTNSLPCTSLVCQTVSSLQLPGSSPLVLLASCHRGWRRGSLCLQVIFKQGKVEISPSNPKKVTCKLIFFNQYSREEMRDKNSFYQLPRRPGWG